MDHRFARLEFIVEFIQRDIEELQGDLRAMQADVDDIRTREFRTLFGTILATGLGLAGLMSIGFHWL